jgi:hypothetical protein
MKKIDYEFIQKWEPKYDEIASDEEEYQNLINIVGLETRNTQTITIVTFERIIDWKSPRAKGKIDWRKYRIYEKALRSIIVSERVNKMSDLVALPGIGAPVASVILHYIFPSLFPIYDFRTVEVLHHFGYLQSKTVSVTCYPEFRYAIRKIQNDLIQYNLRQIDRALFAFHKINFNQGKRKTISSGQIKTQNSGAEPKNKKSKPSIAEIDRSICEKLGADGKTIKRKDIVKIAIKDYGLNQNSILPADYCDNTQTGNWSKHSFLHSKGTGRYVLAEFKS